MRKLFLFLLLAVASSVSAQFYDDEVYIYEQVDGNGLNYDFFLFQGKRGYKQRKSVRLVKDGMKSNPDYLEDMMESAGHELRFYDDDGEHVIYKYNGSGWFGSWTDYFYFSEDKSKMTMVEKDNNGTRKFYYIRVDKEDLLPRSHKKLKEDTIYE